MIQPTSHCLLMLLSIPLRQLPEITMPLPFFSRPPPAAAAAEQNPSILLRSHSLPPRRSEEVMKQPPEKGASLARSPAPRQDCVLTTQKLNSFYSRSFESPHRAAAPLRNSVATFLPREYCEEGRKDGVRDRQEERPLPSSLPSQTV